MQKQEEKEPFLNVMVGPGTKLSGQFKIQTSTSEVLIKFRSNPLIAHVQPPQRGLKQNLIIPP
jgi:hypothetical protein